MTALPPIDEACFAHYRKAGLVKDPTAPNYEMSNIVHEYMHRFSCVLAGKYTTQVLTGEDKSNEKITDGQLDAIWDRMTPLEQMETNIAIAVCKAEVLSQR
jgi:hypothetical protein